MPLMTNNTVIDGLPRVQTPSESQRTRLLQLPQELLIDIISRLTCHDLYALRLTNHELHNLIHENESTIVRNYLSEDVESILKFFKPAKSLSLDYWIHIYFHARRSRILSSILASRCCAKLQPRAPIDDEAAWRQGKTQKLTDAWMMSLYALHEFLANLRQITLRSLYEFEGCSTADFARLGFVLGLDQQRIFESFPAMSLIHITQAWRILEGVANAKGVPLELESTKYPFTTVKVMLVLGGLDRFTALLGKMSLEDRIDDLDAFNAEIWQGQTLRPYVNLEGTLLSSIHHFAAPPKRVSSTDFPTNMSPAAPITFINHQYICEHSAMAVILRSAGTLDDVLPVDQYLCDAVEEKGDPSFRLLSWNTPDNPA